jgi:hypothetical protein
MTMERFNELLNGPLGHPMPLFHCMRLAHALVYVVMKTGQAGDQALEEHCASREQLDRFKAGEDPDDLVGEAEGGEG